MDNKTVSINRSAFVSCVAEINKSASAITTDKERLASWQGSSKVIYRYLRLYNDMEQALRAYQGLLYGDVSDFKAMQDTFANMDTSIQNLWK